MDIGGRDLLNLAGGETILVFAGERVLVWNWFMEKTPTVLDGALRVDLFTNPESDDPSYQFSSIAGHLLTLKSDFEVAAAKAADHAAAVFLPHARRLCADMNATLLEEEEKLERIREALAEEIERVRRLRLEQAKHLKLEVEH